MPAMYKGKIPVITRSLNEGWIRGVGQEAFGCVERDYDLDPVAMGDSPAGMKIIEPSDLDAYYDEQEAAESSLEHLFLRGGKPAFVNLDQGRDGDCWAYSTGHALMFDRLKQNLEPQRVNPHAVAALLNRPDTGGWCGLSMKFVRENGIPLEGTGPGEWPKQSHDKRYYTEACKESMAIRKAEEDWYDLGKREWNQTLTERQLATCGSTNIPCPVDFNIFSHSMLQVRWVRIERGHWGPLILNSWLGFGYFGLCVLAQSIPRASNACALRSSTPSRRAA